MITCADINKDGVISFVEWAEHGSFDKTLSWDRLVETWAHFDVEGKGYLTREEAIYRKA